jgi:hypothetical protein
LQLFACPVAVDGLAPKLGLTLGIGADEEEILLDPGSRLPPHGTALHLER